VRDGGDPSYPVREHLGLISSTSAKATPGVAVSGFSRPGLIENAQFEMPCNWWQSYENVFDEQHAAFVHARSGSHAELGREGGVETEILETPYGFDRRTWVGDGPKRLCVYPWPNHMRLYIGKIKGLGASNGMWLEAFLSHIPTDDEHHIVYMSILVPVGAEKSMRIAKRKPPIANALLRRGRYRKLRSTFSPAGSPSMTT